MIVYALRQIGSIEWFCGGKSTKQRNRFSPDLKRARFYHSEKFARSQAALQNKYKKPDDPKRVVVVRLQFTLAEATTLAP